MHYDKIYGMTERPNYQSMAAQGEKILDDIGSAPTADALWEVIAPIISAIGSQPIIEAGFDEGYDIRTGVEQILQEVIDAQRCGELNQGPAHEAIKL